MSSADSFPEPTRSVPALAGGLSLWMELDSPEAGWGEALRGVLVLRCRAVRAVVGKAEVLLISIKPSDHHDAYVSHRLGRVGWSGFTAHHGETLRFPFSLELPWNTELDRDTQIQARITWPRNGETVLSLSIHVLPPRAYRMVAGLFGEAAALQITGWHSSKNGREIGAALQHLAPSRGPLRRARLHFSRQANEIELTITAELAPRGLADHLFGSWTGRHRSVRSKLLVADAEFRTPALHQCVSHMLDRLLALDLPVPAHPETPSAELLPRPTSFAYRDPATSENQG